MKHGFWQVVAMNQMAKQVTGDAISLRPVEDVFIRVNPWLWPFLGQRSNVVRHGNPHRDLAAVADAPHEGPKSHDRCDECSGRDTIDDVKQGGC